MAQYDCLCLGILVADLVSSPIAEFPPPGGLALVDRLTLTTGGCAANVAVDLAKLGRSVGIVGRVGDDYLGRFIVESLRAAGVGTEPIRQAPPHLATSATQIINVANEDRRFVHAIGSNAAFDGSEVTPELLRSCRVLYLGGYLAMPQLKATVAAELLFQAKQQGITTVLDVVVPPSAQFEDIAPLLRHTDLFVPNRDEAERLSGLLTAESQALCFRDAGVRTVVITDGDKGCLMLHEGEFVDQPPYPVTAIDGTGSGDAFAAGFIAGLLEEQSARDALRMGAACGASCVRTSGATEGVFTRSELEQFLTSHTPDAL